jgi:hypothetical protein
MNKILIRFSRFSWIKNEIKEKQLFSTFSNFYQICFRSTWGRPNIPGVDTRYRQKYVLYWASSRTLKIMRRNLYDIVHS